MQDTESDISSVCIMYKILLMKYICSTVFYFIIRLNCRLTYCISPSCASTDKEYIV